MVLFKDAEDAVLHLNRKQVVAIDHVKETAKYDKIFREVSEPLTTLFIDKILRWNIRHIETLKDKLHTTRQREVDVIKRVTDSDGKQHIFHMEVQAGNDADMPIRMAEYYIMLHRIYKLPIRQYVLYIGKGTANMPRKLDLPNLHFEYPLISLNDLPHELFMSTDLKISMLAILGDLKGKDPKKVTKKIIELIKRGNVSTEEKKQQFMQLRTIAQLRPQYKIMEDIMLDTSTFFKIENDP